MDIRIPEGFSTNIDARISQTKSGGARDMTSITPTLYIIQWFFINLLVKHVEKKNKIGLWNSMPLVIRGSQGQGQGHAVIELDTI